ncbi:hypothetical protein, conserved [Leishmania tarentolae]|uniref:RRM domain-containing protein n=1 Tax=Leishmania tarentolae TaxID=5689 RepID=A0A640KQ74_LEITA|nr:hypothetical protein, conserved [Leishmania tarentolae]
MNAMGEPSADEFQTNALNDLDLFLNIEDNDEDLVLSAGMPTPAVVFQHPPQQNSTLTTAGGQANGVPKLDVTALTSFPVEPNQHPIVGFMAPAISTSPMSFSRELGVDQPNSNVYVMRPAHSSSQASSPQNTSQSLSSVNVYANIANPPLCARALPFRDFLNQKSVPPHIENEESTGIFVGQLPSSYDEDDIEALLKAIGHERGKIVQVRDVKCHNRDRTCAFIMINASALTAILEFTKRVLCDVNCVWIVEQNQAAQLPLFIHQMPREQLRGVPKAALVLEKLTPQSKSRHSNSKSNVVTSPNNGYAAIQTRMLSPIQHSVPSVSVLSHPAFLQQQGVGTSPVAAAGGHVDVPGLQATSPFGGSNYIQATNVNGLSQLFGGSRFPPGAPTGTFFSPGTITSCPNPVYTMQLSNSGIANIEVANQMMLAASRSCGELHNQQLNMLPTSPSSREVISSPPKPTTVTLQPALQSEHCSCGQMLLLSQYPEQGTCAKCHCTILPNDVAYWCVSGHIAVCANCAIKANKPQIGQDIPARRVSSDGKSKHMDAFLTNRAIN